MRTAAEGASEEELRRDVERLQAPVGRDREEAEDRLGARAAAGRAGPGHPGGPRHLQRGLRLADGPGRRRLAPDPRVRRVDGPGPARAGRPAGPATATCSPRTGSTSSCPRAWTARSGCPRGGSLVIDRTEAMTVIDVNTGKFTGSGRHARGDRHPEQPRGRRGDRPPAPAARHRRDHRHRLHRHGAGVQPRPGAAPAGGVPGPRPHQAPGGRGHLARPGADDPQAGRAGPGRGVQRDVPALRGARATSSTPTRSRLRRPPRAASRRRPSAPGGPSARQPSAPAAVPVLPEAREAVKATLATIAAAAAHAHDHDEEQAPREPDAEMIEALALEVVQRAEAAGATETPAEPDGAGRSRRRAEETAAESDAARATEPARGSRAVRTAVRRPTGCHLTGRPRLRTLECRCALRARRSHVS